MMTISRWVILFCFFICYIIFGATVFYLVESVEEQKRLLIEERKKFTIEELLRKHYNSTNDQPLDDIYRIVSEYCSKPLGGYVPQTRPKVTWTFYHSVFYVLTIISTIGYGNLSPTTPFTRTFMIIYGLIGIPINGIVMITLGSFFGTTFIKLYSNWKNKSVRHFLATLGLIGQIIVYSLPGLAIFIFIPSIIITFYEDWTYDLAIEFVFSTLTTIGAGSNVPGITNHYHGEALFVIYRMFLFIWLIMGLGYLAMVFDFISRGLQNKKFHTIERKLAQNIKKTNKKIRQEFRSILNEYLMMRVKPIYRQRRRNITPSSGRTLSCPDLSFYNNKLEFSGTRRRAVSEFTTPSLQFLCKTHSETDLQCIDRERTFMAEDEFDESKKLLLKVATALGNCNTLDGILEDIASKEKFENDTYQYEWNFDDSTANSFKENINKEEESLENHKLQDQQPLRGFGPALISKPQVLLRRLRSSLRRKDINTKDLQENIDVEKQVYKISNSYYLGSTTSLVNQPQLLEEISIEDFLKALNATDVEAPHQQVGFNRHDFFNENKKTRRVTIAPTPRRKISLGRSPSSSTSLRRFSLDTSSATVSDPGVDAILSRFYTVHVTNDSSEVSDHLKKV